MPKRIQRKRTKGWRMPPNTVYVGRPTRWGNPFKLVGDQIMCDASHRRKLLDPWVIYDKDDLYEYGIGNMKIVVLYRSWLHGDFTVDNVVHPTKFSPLHPAQFLRGKDLACWCPLNKPCHADVLLEIANEPNNIPQKS